MSFTRRTVRFQWVAAALLAGTPMLVEAQTRTVVLDSFEVDPYTHFNPDGSDTIVNFPTTTNPPDDTSAGWRWRYLGYGTPATGDRNTATFLDVASWRFFLRQASNLDDPDTGSGDLNAQGPIVATTFNSAGWEPRTFDQILSDLSQPRIDWDQVVRFAVSVRAQWDTNPNLGTFSLIRQGFLIFSYSGGVVQNISDFTYGSGDNDDAWHEATIEVLGRDANDSFILGLYGRVDFDAEASGAPLGDQSPALSFYFDNLRVLYTPLRLENVTATTPIDEGGTTTLSGDVVYANAAVDFDVQVDWGDGGPVETFTYPAGTTSFSETHQYLDDDPTATASDIYPVTVTLVDDEGSGSVATSVTVANVAPLLSGVNVQQTGGGSIVLGGAIVDPGTLDTFALSVDWGDAVQVFNYPAGTTAFSEEHVYGAPNVFTIQLTLVDDDGGTAEARTRAWYIVEEIPALSFTGLLVMGSLLAAVGVGIMRQRLGA